MAQPVIEVVGPAGRIVITESQWPQYELRGYRRLEGTEEGTPAEIRELEEKIQWPEAVPEIPYEADEVEPEAES